MVFEFLTRLTEEADLNQLSEAQAFATLPRFLSGSAETRYRAARGSSRTGAIRSWPDAVQYLLRTYATPASIREAVAKVSSTKQNQGEDETEYSVRLCHAIQRCGNVYDDSRRMTLFINGLIPEIQSVVARYREKNPRDSLQYEDLVQFARDEGITLRARYGTNRRTSTNTPQATSKPVSDTRYPEKRSVHFMDQGTQAEDQNTLPSEHLMMMNHDWHHHHGAAPSSVCTSDLPSTEVSAPRYPPEAEQLL